ncbi:hypothetical protein DPMN_137862 [Dreissena polymorpha]|uniref:Uncharacterized protein n=1 Tax=Dreissena polymorpha TaxID=45954 RepID=A0A9D4G391_DREPO|nr:hypothetical protein DPMN_137862 [Dreissena polymorpha]
MILIPHAYQTDTEAGDYFGATLYTYKWPSGKKYKYQHLLFKIGYPAQKMRIWYKYIEWNYILLANLMRIHSNNYRL